MKLRIIYIYIIHINSIKIIKFQFFYFINKFLYFYNVFIENFQINIFYKMILFIIMTINIYIYFIFLNKLKFEILTVMKIKLLLKKLLKP